MTRKFIENGSKMATNWPENGSKMARKCIQNGSKMAQKWLENASKMARKWPENGSENAYGAWICMHARHMAISLCPSSSMAILVLFVAVPADRGVGVGGRSFSRTRRLRARTNFASIPLSSQTLSRCPSLSTIPSSTSSALSSDAENRNEE